MNDLNGFDLEDLSLGMTATFAKTITEADIVLFAGVSGDNNAIHINEEFAASTPFGGRNVDVVSGEAKVKVGSQKKREEKKKLALASA